ncbi:MAG: glycosyltransferase [Candidatus Moduliflexus flocculans]|nr:glycosyltransferase [Candidatus Moduliflexus flocculans]
MHDDLPKISIIIPMLNMGRYLRECLTTIKKQNYPNIELIIIDGGSTDNTHEILAQYDDMISIFVSEADRGQPDAVTKGLIRATGNIVHWHAADDIVLPGAFKRVVAEFKWHSDVDLVFSDGLGDICKWRYTRPDGTMDKIY